MPTHGEVASIVEPLFVKVRQAVQADHPPVLTEDDLQKLQARVTCGVPPRTLRRARRVAS